MTKTKLLPSMTLAEFDNGYWYATEVKDFAKQIGIPSTNQLRKDELEKAIKSFLQNGKIIRPTQRALKQTGIKDTERGLCLSLRVIHYTNDKETKDFLVGESKKMNPDFKEKSGARYRINRWREEQLTKGRKITYRDLVKHFVRLNQTEGKFEQAPTGRYINFLSDYLITEKNVTRKQAIRVWEELKKLNIPKNYQAWKKYTPSK